MPPADLVECWHFYTHVGIISECQLQPNRFAGSHPVKKDLMAMPEEVQDTFGYALHLAQVGQKHPDTKSLKGFGSAGVLEVVEDFQGDAYRAVYTVRYAKAVYVVHCFQKKSTQGIATPKPDVELIKSRLKAIEVSLGVQK